MELHGELLENDSRYINKHTARVKHSEESKTLSDQILNFISELSVSSL
jgi:hypothetical protein